MGLGIDRLVEARVVEDLLEPVEVAGRDLDLADSGLEEDNRGHVEMLEDLPARGVRQEPAGRPVKTDAGSSQTILEQHVDESGQKQDMAQGIEACLGFEKEGVKHHRLLDDGAEDLLDKHLALVLGEKLSGRTLFLGQVANQDKAGPPLDLGGQERRVGPADSHVHAIDDRLGSRLVLFRPSPAGPLLFDDPRLDGEGEGMPETLVGGEELLSGPLGIVFAEEDLLRQLSGGLFKRGLLGLGGLDDPLGLSPVEGGGVVDDKPVGDLADGAGLL